MQSTNTINGPLTPRQKGVSLIDSLVALAVLAFAIVSIASLTSTTLESNRVSHRLGNALHLAQAKLEEFRALDYTSVVAGTDGPLSATGASSGTGTIYTRSWSVADDVPESGIKSISVNVSWPDKSGPGAVTLWTLAVDR